MKHEKIKMIKTNPKTSSAEKRQNKVMNKKGFVLSTELVYIIIGAIVLFLIFIWLTRGSNDSCGLIANIFGKC